MDRNSISNWLARATPELQGVVDFTSRNSRRRGTLLDRFMPLRTTDSFKLAWAETRKRDTIAHLVAFDGRIPVKQKRIDMNIREQDGIKLAHSCCVTEQDFILARELEVQQQISRGMRIDGLSEVVLPRVEMLSPGVIDLSSVIAYNILSTGIGAYTDPVTGVQVGVQYDTVASLFPAAGPDWSNPATLGLQQLCDWLDEYNFINGTYPAAIAMHSRELNNLLKQDATKAALSANSPNQLLIFDRVNRATLQGFINTYVAPVEIIVDDSTYFEQQKDGSEVEQPFLPYGKVIALHGNRQVEGAQDNGDIPDGLNTDFFLGARFFGPNPSHNYRTGVQLSTKVEDFDPILVTMKASAVYLPVVWDARRLAALDVESTPVPTLPPVPGFPA